VILPRVADPGCRRPALAGHSPESEALAESVTRRPEEGVQRQPSCLDHGVLS
jgi:hypothetical protein